MKNEKVLSQLLNVQLQKSRLTLILWLLLVQFYVAFDKY